MISFDVFKNGKRNAVTLSYDDRTVWDIKLIEILDKYNVNSTFHINSGLLDSGDKNYERLGKKDVADVYKNHEVPPLADEKIWLMWGIIWKKCLKELMT